MRSGSRVIRASKNCSAYSRVIVIGGPWWETASFDTGGVENPLRKTAGRALANYVCKVRETNRRSDAGVAEGGAGFRGGLRLLCLELLEARAQAGIHDFRDST